MCYLRWAKFSSPTWLTSESQKISTSEKIYEETIAKMNPCGICQGNWFTEVNPRKIWEEMLGISKQKKPLLNPFIS